MKASRILRRAKEDIHIRGSYNQGGYCTLGLLACRKGFFGKDGLAKKGFEPEDVLKAYGMKTRGSRKCPSGCGYDNNLARVVIHLNDYHRWTFKQIGEWLEQFENTS